MPDRADDRQDRVDFVVDASYDDLVALYGRASLGLSTMVDEHFGINIVEMMAAGLVPVVHASGGPRLDIVADEADGPTGFHAAGPAGYADAVRRALELPADELLAMRRRARRRARRFDAATFESGWRAAWRELVKRAAAP